MTLAIYIGEQLLDIDSRTIFSFNLKANDVTALNTRNLSYTSGIRIPFSPVNDTIYAGSKLLNSTTSYPYTRKSARVVVNGVVVLDKASHILERVGNGFYQIRIIEPNGEFFDTIKDLYLRDLDFSTLNGALSFNGTCNATTGIVSPVADYGHFAGNDIDASTYLFSIYFHTLIDLIFSTNGFAKTGAVFSDTRYLKTIMPYSKEAYEYSAEFADFRTAIAERTTTIGPLLSNPDPLLNPLDTNVIIKNDSGFYSNLGGYVGSEPLAAIGTGIFYVRVKIVADITIAGVDTVNLKIARADTGTLFDLGVNNVGTGIYAGETVADLQILRNRTFRLVLERNTGPATYTINSFHITWECLTKVSGSFYYFEELMPNFKQVDLIREMAVQFGLVFSGKGKEVVCTKIEDILSDKAGAEDWTEKRVNKTEHDEIDFSPLTFAQLNLFSFSNQDKITNLSLYQGSLPVPNLNAQASKTMYASPFNCSQTLQRGVFNMLYIPVYDTSTNREDFDTSPGLRLALVRDKRSGEPNVVFNSSQSAYKVAYFDDPLETHSMRPQSYIDIYYRLLQLALAQSKLTVREYDLEDADIANFDFTKLVFDENVYLYKQGLGNYQSGKDSKVSFLKIV